MQAIQTKILPPTNTRGCRIKAISWAGSITIPFPDAEYTDDAHMQAARALLEKLEWTDERYYGTLHQGTLPNGDFCHVLVKA